MATMQALCLRSKESKDIGVTEVPVPELKPSEVLLKVQKVGICGSDRSASLGKKNFDWVKRPAILGHEFSATVAEVGAEVSGWEVDQDVTCIAVKGCLQDGCSACLSGNTQLCRNREFMGFSRSGAIAEYVAVQPERLLPLRYGLSHLQGAIIEPLSVASRCVLKHSFIKPSDRVVVSGPGIIGLLCALLARASGGNVTIAGIKADQEVRLKTAQELGFETVVVSDDTPLASYFGSPDDNDAKADVFIEASGAPDALALAGQSTKWKGVISVIATYGASLTWDATYNVRAEQMITTTMASAKDDFEAAMRHLRDGIIPIEKMCKEFTLVDSVAAFEASWDCTAPKSIIAC